MILMILAVWALDVLCLSRQWEAFFREPVSPGKKGLWFLTMVLFILSLSGLIPESVFSAGLFIFLGTHLISRLRMECRSCHQASCEDRGMLKEFLLLCVTGLLLKWFWGVLALSVILHMVDTVFPVVDFELAGASFLSFAAGLWMLVLVTRFQKRVPMFSLRELLGLVRGRGSVFVSWVLPLLTGALIACVSAVFLVSRPDQPVTPFSEMMDWSGMSWAVGLFFCAAVIAAPFLEEIIFRGFFFKMIQEWKGARPAFWTVGAAFGFLHMEQYWGDWAGIAVVFFLGFVLTAFRLISGSARPGIVMHYTFNILMVIIPVILFTSAHPSFTEYYTRREALTFAQKEALLEAGMKEDQENIMVYDELAWLYLEHGDPEKALAFADESVRRMPDRTILQHTRSEALFDLGRVEEAVRILEEIHKQMPANREVARRLKEMKRRE